MNSTESASSKALDVRRRVRGKRTARDRVEALADRMPVRTGHDAADHRVRVGAADAFRGQLDGTPPLDIDAFRQA